MGQRLTINIVKEGSDKSVEKVLANAYFHWEGYTESAGYYTNDVLSFLENNDEKDFADEMLYAIRALEYTEAGFEKDNCPEYSEYHAVKRVYPNEEFNSFDPSENRTMGHISILENTEWAISEAEFMVTINLTTKTVNFGVYDKENFEEFLSDYEDDFTEESLKHFSEYDCDIEKLNFDDAKVIADVLCTEKHIRLTPYPGYVFTAIEN